MCAKKKKVETNKKIVIFVVEFRHVRVYNNTIRTMSITFSWAVKSTTIDEKRKKMEKKNSCVIITVHQSSDTIFYSYIVDNGLNVN